MREHELIIEIDEDLAWRRKDISALFAMCSSKNREVSDAALRASVPMLYAHWEGYVKRIACEYADMISTKKLAYSQLKTCFRGIAAMESVSVLMSVKKKVFVASEAVESIMQIDRKRAAISLESKIERIGNLNYDTFAQISLFLGLPMTPYETKRQFIDKRLVEHRNKIAHGKYLLLDIEGIREMRDHVFELFEYFRNDVQNAVVQKSYLR